MIPRLILYAPNVHTGGGLVLLRALLAAWPQSVPLKAFLDMRARERLALPQDVSVSWVTATIGSRMHAELSLRNAAGVSDTVLCFHGLPPVMPNPARVVVFLQNRMYLGLNGLPRLKFRTRLRVGAERLIGRVFRHRVSEYIVQTPSMERAVLEWYGASASSSTPAVRVLAFVEGLHGHAAHNSVAPKWDFVYVADGEAHKNHGVLVAAWQLLAKEGLRPSLALTLSPRDAELKGELTALVAESGLRIQDLGQMPHADIMALYSATKALIFPSILESFGVPLVEASHMGLPILAPELDYVRDVCMPVQTFDPHSPISIARAVKRFLGCPEPIVDVHTPAEFWRALLGDAPE